MRDWLKFFSRCLWRGHLMTLTTYEFSHGAGPLTVWECEVCRLIKLHAEEIR